MTAGVGLNGQINLFQSLGPLSSARWCPGMGASWLYRKSSSLQCLSNLFLNVLTFGNSFPNLTILTGKDCHLVFSFVPSRHNLKLSSRRLS